MNSLFLLLALLGFRISWARAISRITPAGPSRRMDLRLSLEVALVATLWTP